MKNNRLDDKGGYGDTEQVKFHQLGKAPRPSPEVRGSTSDSDGEGSHLAWRELTQR